MRHHSVSCYFYCRSYSPKATEDNHDAVAAAALVQMHGTTPVGMNTDQARLAEGSQSFPAYSRHQQDTNGLFQSRSYEGAPTFQPPAQYNSLIDPAYDVQHESNACNLQYSDTNLQNTIMTLSKAFMHMQHQQSDI